MKKKLTSVPFSGTPEQKAALDAVIAQHKDEAGALMPVLQKAQDIYGYLPVEVQNAIAEALDIPVSEVFGVATFYSQFLLNPKGQYPVAVCLGTACYVKGSQAVLDKLCEELEIQPGDTTKDGKFTVQATRCLGACGLAPVMMINDDVFGRLTPAEIPSILEKYKAM